MIFTRPYPMPRETDFDPAIIKDLDSKHERIFAKWRFDELKIDKRLQLSLGYGFVRGNRGDIEISHHMIFYVDSQRLYHCIWSYIQGHMMEKGTFDVYLQVYRIELIL